MSEGLGQLHSGQVGTALRSRTTSTSFRQTGGKGMDWVEPAFGECHPPLDAVTCECQTHTGDDLSSWPVADAVLLPKCRPGRHSPGCRASRRSPLCRSRFTTAMWRNTSTELDSA